MLLKTVFRQLKSDIKLRSVNELFLRLNNYLILDTSELKTIWLPL